MARRSAKKKRPTSGARKPGTSPKRPVLPPLSERLKGLPGDATARNGGLGAQGRMPAMTAGLAGVGARPSKAKRAPAHPGPSPLPPARPTPVLARVGGEAGTKSALEFVTFPIAAAAELRPHALGVTYWFDPPTTGGPYEVVLRLTGRRLDVEGDRTADDDFVSSTSLHDVRSDSGRTSLTHRVLGKSPGRWHVTAEAMAVPQGGGQSEIVRLPSAEGVGQSTFAPVASARAPGVVVGAWPAMVSLGVVFALLLQGVLAQKHGLPSGNVLVLALIASAFGAVGAKLYYRFTHWNEHGGRALAGLSVQGFVIVATATFVIGGALQGMPVGTLLDATVPALLLGQTVGRLGCLMGGCCVGVPTRSRWAIWSSDRRVGTRRVPVQLMESGAAATLALVTGAIAWRGSISPAGLLFVGGVAAYVVVRQLLFPLRGIPRATRYGRQATLAVALAALLSALTLSLFT